MTETIMLPAATVEQDAAALLAALNGLHDELRGLFEAAERKVEALRRADTQALQRCSEDESRGLQTTLLLMRRKDAAVAGLAQRLRVPVEGACTVSALLAEIEEPARSHIHARVTGLRELAAKLQDRNKLAERVARDLHSCVRAVFADIALANRETVSYGPAGQKKTRVTEAWVDAVG